MYIWFRVTIFKDACLAFLVGGKIMDWLFSAGIRRSPGERREGVEWGWELREHGPPDGRRSKHFHGRPGVWRDQVPLLPPGGNPPVTVESGRLRNAQYLRHPRSQAHKERIKCYSHHGGKHLIKNSALYSIVLSKWCVKWLYRDFFLIFCRFLSYVMIVQLSPLPVWTWVFEIFAWF